MKQLSSIFSISSISSVPSIFSRMTFAILIGPLLLPSPVQAQTETLSSSAVRQVVVQFHEALARGDSVAVSDLLAENLVVLEGGQAETRDEYLAHHFHSDVAFLSALEKEGEHIDITVEGTVAWAASISRLFGVFRERNIDSNSAELLVLQYRDDGWKISAIHWSSGSRQ